MPVKTATIRSKDAVWIDADIRWAIKERYMLLKKQNAAVKTKTGANKDSAKIGYQTYRNLVTTNIRDRKLIFKWTWFQHIF